jgi:hypothetical protein
MYTQMKIKNAWAYSICFQYHRQVRHSGLCFFAIENSEPKKQLLLPVILATKKAMIKRIEVQSQPGPRVHETHHNKGLVEWLKV